ncbi:MAG: bifunctional UDP-N-acetylglucosamine diphosphorylase/glucosamine-1-phosphate N-acetyltransferase GlmU [Thermaerobacter sp.]|nr:bifunctional UDP-N-acetylglucosamine diphosphorylase/glucosamine-1-phosphate N-acetyltransferase GlmU [Thermaerobacter sp.]
MGNTAVVILAAGRGTRMRSAMAKALHPLGGVPLVEHVVRAVRLAGLSTPWVVVGFQAERVEEILEAKAYSVRQPLLRGTGDALLRALDAIGDGYDQVLVLYGDGPLVPPDLIQELLAVHQAGGAACTLVSTMMPDPSGYGRIVRAADGQVAAIAEEREASPAQRAIREINTGLGVWRVAGLRRILAELPWHGEEQYLTDAVTGLLAQGAKVEAMVAPDCKRVMGINTRRELAEAEAIMRRLTLDRMLEAGVTILDPATTYIDAEVEIGQDTVIHPMTFLRGATKVGRDCELGPMTTITASRLADGVVVTRSVVEQSVLASKARVGPFSHLRAGTSLDRDVKIGNFVELKNTRVGIGTKAGHHAYLGDATIGGRVNIGAGTIIVNYDGIAKNPTFIGDEAFVGCNVNLVAPVEIGPGAYVAAGSTVTQNVPGEALAIARARQENKTGWVTTWKLQGGDRAPRP